MSNELICFLLLHKFKSSSFIKKVRIYTYFEIKGTHVDVKC